MQDNFNCPRTCPLVGNFWCRFRPVLDRLGRVQVNSHTVRVKVEYTDPGALERAVQALGGKWLGSGSHRLFEGMVTGHGFKLDQWNYPIVLQPNGELAFDDFNGRWGNPADLERLKGEYALAVAEQAAQTQGWLCERTEVGLRVHHPSGGTLDVTPGGMVDACGFVGHGCHDAILALRMPVLEAQVKPEYGQVAAQVQLPAG